MGISLSQQVEHKHQKTVLCDVGHKKMVVIFKESKHVVTVDVRIYVKL